MHHVVCFGCVQRLYSGGPRTSTISLPGERCAVQAGPQRVRSQVHIKLAHTVAAHLACPSYTEFTIDARCALPIRLRMAWQAGVTSNAS